MAIVNAPRASEGLRALVGRLLVNFMQPHQLIENLFLRQVFADRRDPPWGSLAAPPSMAARCGSRAREM